MDRAAGIPDPRPVVIGISTKAYFGYQRTLDWLEEVARVARSSPGIRDGSVQLFLAPAAPMLEAAVRLTAGTGVRIAAQDVSEHGPGAFTGDVDAALLAELGVAIAEVGHAERRRLHGETDEMVAAKAEAARAAGLIPLVCVGERAPVAPAAAAEACLRQLALVGPGPLLVAYEPVWAIAAAAPARPGHVRTVIHHLKRGLPAGSDGAAFLYGGSAGPGLLAALRPVVDGLFLGRFAHDPSVVATVLAEAERRSETESL